MRVIFLLGTTASGKSAMALDLAQKYSAEIVNADSIQVYQGLNIGSAKPSAEDLQKVPHHLYSFVEKGKNFTAGDYEKAALETLSNLKSELAIVVGGSGFYLQALEKGMFAAEKPPQEVKEAVEARLLSEGLDLLYQELSKKDPEYAENISPQDSYRILRAHEVLLQNKKPSTLKQSFQSREFPYPLLKMGIHLPKEILKARVKKRCAQMIEAGLIEETSALRKEGLSEWSALNSVGYKEVQEFLNGQIEKADLEEKITTKTMQLAKKQRTWFRRDPEIQWLSEKKQAEILIEDFLERQYD